MPLHPTARREGGEEGEGEKSFPEVGIGGSRRRSRSLLLSHGQVPVDWTRHVSAVGRERGRVAASFPRANHVRS